MIGMKTYAPITYRPTEYPTSSIREPKMPTILPAPSILPFIVGLMDFDDTSGNGTGVNGTNTTNANAAYYINGTNRINLTAIVIGSGGGLDSDGDGVVSKGEMFSHPEVGNVEENATTSMYPTVTPSPFFSALTMPPNYVPINDAASVTTTPPGMPPPPVVPGTTAPPTGKIAACSPEDLQYIKVQCHRKQQLTMGLWVHRHHQ